MLLLVVRDRALQVEEHSRAAKRVAERRLLDDRGGLVVSADAGDDGCTAANTSAALHAR